MSMEMIKSKWSVFGKDCVFFTSASAKDSYSERVRESWKIEANALIACQLLSAGDTFFDFGANIGVFSVPVAITTSAKAIAIEALPVNAALLRNAVSANSVDIRVIEAAVGGADGFVYFEGESAYGHISNKPTDLRVLSLNAETITKEYSGGLVPKLVKIDIEGSELSCLKGAKSFFTNLNLKHVIIEANGPHCIKNGYTPQDLLKALEEYGFSCYLIDGYNLVKRGSQDFQEFGNCDYLATKEENLFLTYPMLRSVTFDEERIFKSVLHTCLNMKKQYREFMYCQLDYANLSPSFRASISKVLDKI